MGLDALLDDNKNNRPTPKIIDQATSLLAQVMAEGLEECLISPKQPKKKEAYNNKRKGTTDTRLNQLLQEKSALLNSMTGKNKTKIKRLWTEVQKKQKQIQKIASQAWIKINQEWWEEISQLDAKSEPSEFYKLCRKFKFKQHSKMMKVKCTEQRRTSKNT